MLDIITKNVWLTSFFTMLVHFDEFENEPELWEALGKFIGRQPRSYARFVWPTNNL